MNEPVEAFTEILIVYRDLENECRRLVNAIAVADGSSTSSADIEAQLVKINERLRKLDAVREEAKDGKPE